MTLSGLPEPNLAKVECGACRKCCKGQQLILLVEGDDRERYQCHEIKPGVFAVDRNANGDCIYLGPTGCTIWGSHPKVCRVFSCADFVRRMDEGAFDGFGEHLGNDVIREGRKRLRRSK